MRMLHVFEEEGDAEVLADALFVESIQATVRDTRDGQWALWVHDDDHMDRAKALLEEMLENPEAPQFTARQREAQSQRKEIAKEEKRTRHREIKARAKLQEQRGSGLVTLGLIGLSVGVYFLETARPEIGRALTPITMGYADAQSGGIVLDLASTLSRTISSGQIWRLLTPIFIHGGLLHLLFNMLWLRDLGTIVERAHSPWRLVMMTVIFGVAGVVVQLAVGGIAVGMSGVVFGLFAYIWMRGRYDPTFGYGINRTTVIWMMVWYVICFFPGLGIANGAHTAGLVLGAAWGFLASGYLRRKIDR